MLILSFVLGCSENKLTRHTDGEGVFDFPTIEVTPTAYDFGALYADERGQTIVTVTNVGTEGSELTVGEIVLSVGGEEGFTLTDASTEAQTLRYQESIEFVVQYSPLEPTSSYGVIEVHSDDEENPVVYVELTGEGIMPELLVTPDPLTYEETTVGCQTTEQVTLMNVGNAPLVITDVGSTSAYGEFALQTRPPFPLELAPDESATLTMVYMPVVAGDAAGNIVVSSDDPRGVVQTVQMGTAVLPGTYIDETVVPTAGKIDLLFLPDQSVSMDDDQVLLAGQATALAEALGALTDDWQLMVVSRDNGCNSGGILTSTTENFVEKFTAAVQEGDERTPGWGVYTESLIYLGWLAVNNAEPDAEGFPGCNEGFARSDALLHAIVITDEYYDELPLPASAPSWWEALEDMRLHQEADYLVKFSAVANPSNAAGYATIINETDGTMLDITSLWSEQVDTVAASDITQDVFPLSATPDETTIHVYVDGVQRWDWQYRSDVRAVRFTEGVRSGSLVSITYDVPFTCE